MTKVVACLRIYPDEYDRFRQAMPDVFPPTFEEWKAGEETLAERIKARGDAVRDTPIHFQFVVEYAAATGQPMTQYMLDALVASKPHFDKLQRK